MFEYSPFACNNENCELHGQVQYRAWQRSDTTHLRGVWLSHNSCQGCNRELMDYMTHMRDRYQNTGYVPPMVTMRCANKACERLAVEVPQNFDPEFRGTNADWYHGNDGKCPQCNRGMMTDLEWAQWRS